LIKEIEKLNYNAEPCGIPAQYLKVVSNCEVPYQSTSGHGAGSGSAPKANIVG
jgi:hypothetical protein